MSALADAVSPLPDTPTRRAPSRTASAAARLYAVGAGTLSDAELLQLVGAPDIPLAELVQELPHALRSRLGTRAAARVLAALELGRRALRTEDSRRRLRSPQEIFAYLEPSLANLPREVFHVLCLNSRNTLVADVRIAEGTVNMCPVDPRELFSAVLRTRATALVLAHNHPSGDPEPSSLDIQLTKQLIAGAKLLNLELLDHVVVGGGRYVSLLERGLMRAQ